MRLFTKKVLSVCGLALALSVTGCGEKEEKEEEEADPTVAGGGAGGGTTDTVTVAGKLAVTGTTLALLTPAIADLKLFCVTFEATPRSGTSEFGTDGAFSVAMPKNVNFGCFVNNKTTNMPVAQFVVAAEGGFGGGSTSLGLSASIDLGALVLGDDGTVQIPAAAFASVASTAGTSIDLDLLHNHTFKMECQDNGNAESLAACKHDIAADGADPMTVYLRILKGKQGDKDVTGMGVWQDAATFTACGAVDMTAAMQTKIAADGITFSQASVGTFTPGTGCESRSASEGGGSDDNPARNLRGYYAISELVANGSGYSFRDHGGSQSGTCSSEHSTAIEFTGTSDVMFGAFTNSEQESGDCGPTAAGDSLSSFSVKFTRID